VWAERRRRKEVARPGRRVKARANDVVSAKHRTEFHKMRGKEFNEQNTDNSNFIDEK